METETTTTQQPDEPAMDRDLLCPLCEYNLRGLTQPRCPKCGFAFTWKELLDAEQNKHPYLFEYGRGRNIKTFWKTFWRTCRPRRFWAEVNPAQDVRLVRLVVYWLLASSMLLGLVLSPTLTLTVQMAWRTMQLRSDFSPSTELKGEVTSSDGITMSVASFNREFPPPWSVEFWIEVRQALSRRSWLRFNKYSYAENLMLGWGAVYLCWPVLSLGCMMIFRISMRQAKIRTVHLLRAVVYSTDFSILLLLVASLYAWTEPEHNSGWVLLEGCVFLSAIASYRLGIAMKRYLRVHLPWATVLSAQLIALLLAFLALVQIADFSRRI